MSQCVHDTTKSEHMQYLHVAAFSPVPVTWIKAIQNGNFTSWPGLTAKAVAKHLPKSIATSKGHLDQKLNNIRSTQPKEPELPEPEVEQLDQPTHLLFASIEPIGRVYTDQTGRFPYLHLYQEQFDMMLINKTSDSRQWNTYTALRIHLFDTTLLYLLSFVFLKNFCQ